MSSLSVPTASDQILFIAARLDTSFQPGGMPQKQTQILCAPDVVSFQCYNQMIFVTLSLYQIP